MKNKMNVSLAICLMLCFTMVSAVSIENVESKYNGKGNVLDVSFDEVLDNECARINIKILDKHGNFVGGIVKNALEPCVIIEKGTRDSPPVIIRDDRQTGIFNYKYSFDLIDKKYIKGIGRLRYEISYIGNNMILAEGRLK